MANPVTKSPDPSHVAVRQEVEADVLGLMRFEVELECDDRNGTAFLHVGTPEANARKPGARHAHISHGFSYEL